MALLAAHFSTAAARKFGKFITDIASDSLAALQNYAWPGNVRELQNVIDRAAILSNSALLEIHDTLDGARPQTMESGTLEEVESAYIQQILEESNWVIEGERGAAKRLGLNPSTLRGRMRKYGISKNR